jgi:hypothetical protein
MAYANVNQNTKERESDILVVTASAAASEGDLIIFGPWVGIALHDALISTNLSLYVGGDKEYDAVSAVAVAAAVGDELYYNPTTGAYAAAAESGSYLVGYTTVIKNSDNVFRFEKLRRHTAYSAPLTFAGLADVNVTGVDDNDTLKYVQSTGKWTKVAV